ncbi:MAG: hypothetical protein AAFV88_12475 [Planctomycetota bacterium]
MSSTQFDGQLLKQTVRQQFKNADNMIALSEGKLTANKRSAIFRAMSGEPVDSKLAEIIAELLGMTVESLSARRPTFLRLSKDAHDLNRAIRLLSQFAEADHPQHASGLECVAAWLASKLHLSIDDESRLCDQLWRLGRIQKCPGGRWAIVKPTFCRITRLLKRRIAFQWPIVREVFSAKRTARKKTAKLMQELIMDAELKLNDPLAFFRIDDQIHECLCVDPFEVELVRISRNASWSIVCDLIADLSEQNEKDPQSALDSMASVAGWVLEDYGQWVFQLNQPEVGDLDAIYRRFRRHVLRMRDYAQYYA